MRVDLQDIAEFHARPAALVDALNLLFCEGSVPEREVVDCAGEFGGVGKIRRPLPDAERVAGRKGEVCERGGLLAQGAIGGTLALIYPEGAIVADHGVESPDSGCLPVEVQIEAFAAVGGMHVDVGLAALCGRKYESFFLCDPF